jgi:hypothetical protein
MQSGEIASHFASQTDLTPVFPGQPAFVRFLPPPRHAGRAIHGPRPLFFARPPAAGLPLIMNRSKCVPGSHSSTRPSARYEWSLIGLWGHVTPSQLSLDLPELPDDLLSCELLSSWHLVPSLGLHHLEILSVEVATFQGGQVNRATLVIDTRSIHVTGECHGSIKNGGGRFTFARVGE